MNVKIYSTPTCHWCAAAKDFFKGHKIAFTEFDVSTDRKAAEEMIKKTGQRGVPVIDVGGKIIIGFDEDEIKSALKIK